MTKRAKLLALADRVEAEAEWLIGGKARRRQREIARELRELANSRQSSRPDGEAGQKLDAVRVDGCGGVW